jgi:hypothetical protein
MLSKEDHLAAYSAFLEHRWGKWPSERVRHASYDLSERVRQYEWSFLADSLVSDHLRELSNNLNFWGARIADLQAWLAVITNVGSEKSWAIRSTFVEVIASFCVLQPYSLREKFLISSIQILHQGNLATDRSYSDELLEDGKRRYLTFQEKRNSLNKVGQRWLKYGYFEEALLRLNSSAFKSTVKNFRNLHNHGHAPNFEEGEGIFVVRSIGEIEDLFERSDGTVDVVTKKAVVYGFGGVPPISLDVALEAVVKEFGYAIQALDCLHDLTEEICSQLSKKEKINND